LALADALWNPTWQLFEESSKANPITESFWSDDQMKILEMMLEDTNTFASNISETIN
jgi:hypothetical protein